MKYDLIIFDLGSTLIKYENRPWEELGLMGCENAVPALKKATGREVKAEKLWCEFRDTINSMFISDGEDFTEINLVEATSRILSNLGFIISDGLPQEFIDAYYRPTGDQISLIPGARAIISKLKKAGAKIGLVSNTIFPAEYHRSEMRDFGIFDYFDFTIFSSEEKIRKPNKKIYHKALSLADSAPESALFIGDRLVEDVGGPQSVGMRGVLKYVEGRDYSAPIEPFETIHELRELEKIIFG